MSLTLNLANNIQLEMPRIPKRGNPESGLVENNFGTTSASHGDQSFPQHYYNSNVQLHNYSAPLQDSNLIALQTLWPSLYLLNLIGVPWILLDCNFIEQIRLLRFQIFHSTNFTAHMSCDFPLVVVFATSTSGRFVKLSYNFQVPNLIKQLFHSRLLDMRLVIANSYPTRAHGIIVKYSPIFKTAHIAKKIWRENI